MSMKILAAVAAGSSLGSPRPIFWIGLAQRTEHVVSGKIDFECDQPQSRIWGSLRLEDWDRKIGFLFSNYQSQS